MNAEIVYDVITFNINLFCAAVIQLHWCTYSAECTCVMILSTALYCVLCSSALSVLCTV